MSDLINRWLFAPSPSPAALRGHGVSHRAVLWAGGVRLARDGRWTLPAWADPPSPYHVVAEPLLLALVTFDPATPDTWTLYPPDADVVMLGECMLAEAIWHSEPLPVFRDPLNWLRAGGAGVVPLDWAAFVNELTWSGVVPIAEDIAHGELIKHHRDKAVNFERPDILVRTAA